jgi:antirestriction protein ArdC
MLDIDTIFMPPFERFLDAASFYSSLGHEAAHSTAAKHRLDRDLTGRFGSAKYAMDEVVCELTSSFVLADLGIAHRPRAEHAAYIASWLKALKDDPRAIFTAASKAQQAADWMHAQKPGSAAAPPRATAGMPIFPQQLSRKRL